MIIAVHNSEETLGLQLEALVCQDSEYPFQTIVVLNRCTDRSGDVAMDYESHLNVLIVEANVYGSAAYARNVGAALAQGQCLLFCDGDDQAGAGWVKGISQPILAGAVDVVAGNIHVVRAGTTEWIYEKYYKALDGPDLQWYHESIRYPLGASLGISRSAFESVGGFDEHFVGAGSEEIDLTLRLLRSGFRLGEAPSAVMNYHPRRKLAAILRQRQNYAAGEALLLAKEGELPTYKTLSRQVWSATRAAAATIIRRREYRPIAPIMAFADTVMLDRAFNRKNGERTGGELVPERFTDFVAPPSSPLIGGLGFACARGVEGWWARSGVEASSLRLLDSLLPDSGTFVDAGANIGVFSVAAARKVASLGQVIAFEVNSEMCGILEINTTRHGVRAQVSIVNTALGAEAGEKEFIQYSNDLVSSFYPAPVTNHPGDIVSATMVQVTTLDAACPPEMDMLKIDVEGAEHEVLRGATAILSSERPPIVIMEWNPLTMRSAGTSSLDLLSHFPVTDWTLWLIQDHPESITRLCPFGAHEAAALETDTSGWYANILAIPHRARPEAINVIQRFIAG